MLEALTSVPKDALNQKIVYENGVCKLEQDFFLGEILGQGGYGRIIKARHKCDDNEYAIKIIKFDNSNLDDMAYKRREVQMLSKLYHKNIVRYFNSWMETAQVPVAEYNEMCSSEESLSDQIRKLSANKYISSSIESFLDSPDNDEGREGMEVNDSKDSFMEFENSAEEYKKISFLYIQMELCAKQTLRTAIEDCLYLKESQLTKYFTEICEGLSYIHGQNIIHRDLKPENIFLTSDDVIKIGDFGLCKKMDISKSSPDYLDSSSFICGTLPYVAPEILKGDPLTVKADMYSLGIIYFEMCSKPMTKMELQHILQRKIKSSDFSWDSYEKVDIIRGLLNANPANRPSPEKLLQKLNSKKSEQDNLDSKKSSPF